MSSFATATRFTCPLTLQDFAGGRGDAGVTDAVELDARRRDLVADADCTIAKTMPFSSARVDTSP